MDREAWRATGHGVAKSETRRVTEHARCPLGLEQSQSQLSPMNLSSPLQLVRNPTDSPDQLPVLSGMSLTTPNYLATKDLVELKMSSFPCSPQI